MRIKGYFKIEVVDVNTGEVVREFESPNNVTTWGFDRIALFRWWGIDYGGYSPWDRQHTIWLSPDVYDARMRTVRLRTTSEFGPGDTTLATEFVTSAIGNPLRQEYIAAAGPVPAAYQVFGQFNPPPAGITRTINTIGCGSGSDELHAFTDISAAPCIQTDTQQLNVTYRTQFFDDPVPTISDVWRNPNTVEYFAQQVCDTQADGAALPSEIDTPDQASPFYFSKTMLPHIAPAEYDNMAHFRNSDNHGTGTGSQLNFSAFPGIPDYTRETRATGNCNKHIWNFDWTISEGIGRIYGSMILGSQNHEMLQTPFAPSDFPNTPIQTIHNHSANATQPFLDTNFLATGQGSISMDGSAWSSTSRHPLMFRVQMTETGDVGTSRYHYQWRHVSGGLQAELSNSLEKWRGVFEPIPWFSYDQSTYWPGVIFRRVFPVSGNEVGEQNYTMNVEEWIDNESVVVFRNDKGVSLVNLYTGNFVIFDNTTTPAFPASKIYQVAVSDNGTIWAADADLGLYRITDPFGSPTVTKMTVAAHGIPAGTEQCYAVHQGYNDSIWAVFDGGLSKTTDGGTTWTNHDPGSVPAFNYTSNGGISNSNWSNVRMMAVDRETPDNEMCIQYVNPGSTANQRAYHAWWSEVGTSFAGPGGNNNTVDDTRSVLKSDSGTARQRLRCSRRGGMFVLLINPGSSSYQSCHLYFGRNDYRQIRLIPNNVNGNTNMQWNNSARPTFHYDQYGTPHTWSSTSGSGYTTPRGGLFNWYLNSTGNMWADDNFFPMQSFEQFGNPTDPHEFTGFTMAMGRDPNISGEYRPRTDRYLWGDLWSGNFMGPLNQNETRSDDTMTQDLMWKDVRWNGADWETDYHAPAPDSSGNGFDGTRRGFRIEDLTFRARATIEIPSAAGANFGSGDLTFVATVRPINQINSTENAQQHALLSWTNNLPGSKRDEYTFYWDRFHKTDAVEPVLSPTPQLGAGRYSRTGTPLGENNTTGGFGNTPADFGIYRVVFTLSGTQLRIYIDGVEQGTVGGQTISGMSTSAANMQRIIIGARSGVISNFFHGEIYNIQLWNYPWTPADAVTDAGNPTGVNVPAGGALSNLIVHYQNNVSIAGMESKATHLGQENLKDGITIGFANGTTSPAFVATDYYTVGVCDGVFKDNAISFDYHHELYTTPVVYDFSDVEDSVNTPAVSSTSAIIPASGGQITDIPVWRQYDSGAGYYIYLSSHGEVGSFGGGDRNITTFQQLTGNGYIEWTIPTTFATDGLGVGLTENPTDPTNAVGFTYLCRYKVSGTGASFRAYELVVNDTIVVSPGGPDQYSPGDTFRMEKSGSTVTFRHNGALVHTFTRPSVAPMWGRARLQGEVGSTIIDMKINYTRPAGYLDLGNSLALPTPTGKYDPNHLNIDSIGVSGTINGTPFTAVKDNRTLRMEELPLSASYPGVGEALIIYDAGLLLFNPADYGKTVTVNYIHVKFE